MKIKKLDIGDILKTHKGSLNTDIESECFILNVDFSDTSYITYENGRIFCHKAPNSVEVAVSKQINAYKIIKDDEK